MSLFAGPAPFVRSFSFDEGDAHIAGGSAVVVAAASAPCRNAFAAAAERDDFQWTDAQTAAFLAGGPLTLGWVTEGPAERDQSRVYVCCWITIEND